MVDLTDLTQPPVENHAVYELSFGINTLPAVEAGRDLGLFNFLDSQPASISQVASEFSITMRAAEAILVVPSALGFLSSTNGETFELSDLGREYLLPDSPYFSGGHFEFSRARISEYFESVKKAVVNDGHQDNQFAVNIAELPPEAISGFIGLMHVLTLPAAAGLGQLDIFENIRSILDVGGGSGSLSMAITANNPDTQSTIMDLEPISEIATSNVAEYGLSDRVSTMAGDMFKDQWPYGHDAILFGNIFHDWDVDSCQQLAQSAYDALPPGGQIMLHEILLAENKSEPLLAACFSVTMLVFEKGKQYTFSELKTMLENAGFRDCKVTPSFGYYSVVSATK
jgi:acetylserotonin N-methyltransferase